jgi:hypothetical protein
MDTYSPFIKYLFSKSVDFTPIAINLLPLSVTQNKFLAVLEEVFSRSGNRIDKNLLRKYLYHVSTEILLLLFAQAQF